MFFQSTFLLLAAAVGLSNAQCSADNCARAVTGTVSGLAAQSSHKADCSSFFKVTVTPKTSTSTVYRTVTSATTTQTASTETDTVTSVASTETDTVVVTSITNIPANAKRQVTISPSAVPAYASACSGVARYSSACSCFGVTKTTITAPTPITVTTIIVSATPTQTITATTVTTLPVTTTTFVTSTTTVIQCGGVTPGGGSCGCSYTEMCNTQFVSTDGQVDTNNNVALSDCAHLCDDNFECAAFVFQKSTGTCTQIKGSYNSVPNSDYVSGPITSGSCGGLCTQSYKRDLEGMLEDVMLAAREAAPAPVGGKTFVGTVDEQ